MYASGSWNRISRQSVLLEQLLELVADPVTVEWGTKRAWEDQTVLLPPLTQRSLDQLLLVAMRD